MLELIYHTSTFGPIHFAYSGPVVRVGQSEDNDLVVRHPSVEPYHCLLVFRGEKIICLPPDQAVSSDSDLAELAGPEFGAGDQIRVGELQFGLAHSARTVAIPELGRGEARGGATGASEGTSQRRFFCGHCRKFIPHQEVKHLGLVGHTKRSLCPKCSSLLEMEPEPAKPVSGFKRWLRWAMGKLT